MNFYTLFNPVRKKRGRLFKLLLVMKLVTILITAACLQVSATAVAQKITLSEKDASLEKVFNDIKKQTGYIFFYENDVLKGTSKVTIDVKNEELPDVLNLCFKNQPLAYTIAGNTIGVKKKETAIQEQTKPQANKDITGQVLTKQQIPLVGASVIVKRTQSGTLTDVKGNFVLRDIFSDDVITITYIGYKPLSFTVGDKTVFNLTLEETTNSLDQVVVQAYGQTSQRLNTGNIGTVTSAQIEKQPNMNPLLALEGQVPGVVVTQTNGYASSPLKIEIRGRSQIDAGQPSDPLYIIDGVPLTVLNLDGSNYVTGSAGFTQASNFTGPAGGQSPFFSINPQDIESISVLKDADATAIYGSRGANGVIIITTKSGKAGKAKVDLNIYEGASEITGRYPLLNTQQYIEMRQEAFKNDQTTYGLIPGFTIPDGQTAYDLLTWDANRYTNWQNTLWGNIGHTTDAELSLSGGDALNTYRVSGSYHHETSILSRSGADQRGSGQFNFTHKSPNQKFTLSLTSLYSFTQSNLLSVGGNVLEAPDAPAVFNSEGNLNYAGYQPVPTSVSAWGSLFQPYVAQTGFLNSQLSLKYQIIKGLDFSTQFGYSTVHVNNSSLVPIISQYPRRNTTGNSQFGVSSSTNTIVEPQLNYKTIIKKGELNILLGASTQDVGTSSDYLYGTGYLNDNLLKSINNAPISTVRDGYAQYKYAAAYARLNYNWEDKYLINMTARRDGSSRFGPGKQYGNFGAVGAAWIFSQESLIKDNLSWLSFGKVRASYGITGNDQIGDYGYLTTWTTSFGPYEGIPAYYPTKHANPNLEWETNKKLEVAIDLGFFKDRITTELSWYRNICGNQLVAEPLATITGFDFVQANLPATIQNTGLEFLLKGKIIDKKDFAWSASFNIGYNRNKLLAFPGLAQSPYASTFTIGEPLNMVRVLHYTGVDPLTGQYTFEDKNHDGKISLNYNNGNNDLYNKDLSIPFDGGFTTEFRYKSFEASLFFNFRKQQLRNAIYTSGLPGSVELNQSIAVLNRWQKPGDQSEFARFSTSGSITDTYFTRSDGIYGDGSFIRLKNASISYSLPKLWVNKIGLTECKIYARGENLLLLTKYEGLDPETPGLGALPPAKIFTIGLQFEL